MPNNGIAGLCANSTCNLLRNCQAVFQGGMINLTLISMRKLHVPTDYTLDDADVTAVISGEGGTGV